MFVAAALIMIAKMEITHSIDGWMDGFNKM